MVVNPDGTVQFEGDVTKLMRGANAAAPGADLAAANRAARVAKYGADAVTGMEAAGSRFGGASGAATTPAISTPTATNPAPVATAAAESGLTFGQRALRALRVGGRALGAVGIGLTAAQSAGKTYETPTEDYEKRFGIGPSNLDSPGLRFARDLGVRSAGALVDLGNTLNPFASTGHALAPNGGANAAAAPTAAPSTSIPAGVTAYGAPALAPQEVQDLINGKKPIPALGTGGAVNTRTGRTLAFNTGVPAAAAAPVDQTGETTPSTSLPVLGTKGGIFNSLAKFSGEVAAQRGATAASGQSFNRYLKTAGVETKRQEAQARGLAATGTYLRGAAAVADAGDKNKKVTVDAMGNPVIVDTKNQTALAPKVNQPVTEADITATMKANKMSREAVLARLRAEGRMN
jgi:hypothetical protein